MEPIQRLKHVKFSLILVVLEGTLLQRDTLHHAQPYDERCGIPELNYDTVSNFPLICLFVSVR